MNPTAESTDRNVPSIHVDGISKSFCNLAGENLTVLSNISLTLGRGEIVALLGSSGCGKSTLLNIIAGLQTPDAGSITVEGRNVSPRQMPSIGYVFQEDRLLPWRTALRNVTFSLEAGSMPRRERLARGRKALDLMNLGGNFCDAFPHQLSGGMRSRVALARALATDPTILLMDEPFGRLDALTRQQMHSELLRVKELLGMSIVFVTHDVDEAVMLANRVIVLSARPGRIKEVVKIDLPRPRDGESEEAATYIRQLKKLIG